MDTSAEKLARRLAQLETDNDRMAHLRRAAGSATNWRGADVVNVAAAFDWDWNRFDAVKLLARWCCGSSACVSILRTFNGDTHRVAAVRELAPRALLGLSSVAATFDHDHSRIEGCRKVVEEAGPGGLSTEDALSAVRSFDSDSHRIELVRCLHANGYTLPDSVLGDFATDSYRGEARQYVALSGPEVGEELLGGYRPGAIDEYCDRGGLGDPTSVTAIAVSELERPARHTVEDEVRAELRRSRSPGRITQAERGIDRTRAAVAARTSRGERSRSRSPGKISQAERDIDWTTGQRLLDAYFSGIGTLAPPPPEALPEIARLYQQFLLDRSKAAKSERPAPASALDGAVVPLARAGGGHLAIGRIESPAPVPTPSTTITTGTPMSSAPAPAPSTTASYAPAPWDPDRISHCALLDLLRWSPAATHVLPAPVLAPSTAAEPTESSASIPAPATTAVDRTAAINTCKICMDAPADTVCTPCGHMCACSACGKRVMERTHSCPVCRADIEKLVHVYFT